MLTYKKGAGKMRNTINSSDPSQVSALESLQVYNLPDYYFEEKNANHETVCVVCGNPVSKYDEHESGTCIDCFKSNIE